MKNQVQLRSLIKETIQQVELENEAIFLSEEIHHSSQFLNEDLEDLVKKIAATALKVSPDEIPDVSDAEGAKEFQAKMAKKGEEVNESIAVTLALLTPAILELVSKLANKIKSKVSFNDEELAEYEKNKAALKKLKKEDPGPKSTEVDKEKWRAELKRLKKLVQISNVGKWLHKASHGLHKVYTSPIRLLLWTISLATKKGSRLRDDEWRTKCANVIYACLMIWLAGTGIKEALSSLEGVEQFLTLIADVAKEGVSIADIVKAVLPKLLA
jgi:hypothetical protein